MANLHINQDTEIQESNITLKQLAEFINRMTNGELTNFVTNNSSNWLSSTLNSQGIKRIGGIGYDDGTNNAGELSLGYKNGQIYPYTDGYFYQNEGNYRCLDTSCAKLLWSYDGTGWGDGYADIDVSPYDFISISTTHGSAFVPADACYGNLAYNYWDGTVNRDNAFDRGFWRQGNGIQFSVCYGRGINGYTGFNQNNDILVPRRIWGFKFTK